MTTNLYNVTLTDLVTYDITVAADTDAEATSIATSVLHEEVTTLQCGTRIIERHTEAKAVVASTQPLRRFKVHGRYALNFSLEVPATESGEAVRHARRLYAESCGPFEFEHDGGDIERLVAEEVRS